MKETEKTMQKIGEAVNDLIPGNFGFFVLVFPFGETENPCANYISNGKREDVVNAMKEFLIRAGHEEDWMKKV